MFDPKAKTAWTEDHTYSKYHQIWLKLKCWSRNLHPFQTFFVSRVILALFFVLVILKTLRDFKISSFSSVYIYIFFLWNTRCLINRINLGFSWRRSLSYGNQCLDLLCKSLGWLLYCRDHRQERVIMKQKLSQCR